MNTTTTATSSTDQRPRLDVDVARFAAALADRCPVCRTHPRRESDPAPAPRVA
jgi:hypothetical protein